jgi:hypothetical protein
MASRLLNDLINRLDIAGELLHFMWTRKLWWMIPMILLLLVLGTLLVFSQIAGVAPFIYSLF